MMLLALEKRVDALLAMDDPTPEDEYKELYPFIWLHYDLPEDYENKKPVDAQLR